MTQLCSICPRGCGVDRAGGQFGFCAVPDAPVVARAAPHFGEEPCISGTRGSGAVFFSGCNLRCVFCQNRTISRGEHGKEITVAQLRGIFLRLRDEGVHNINLVTPSHYTRQIAEALSGLELGIPVVWNSSGYECVETLRMLDGLVQVYLPDLKYALSEPAARYSAAADYPQVARAAILEMYRQTGPFRLDEDGMLQRGVLIRHLILPQQGGKHPPRHRLGRADICTRPSAFQPHEPVHTRRRSGAVAGAAASHLPGAKRRNVPVPDRQPDHRRLLSGSRCRDRRHDPGV